MRDKMFTYFPQWVLFDRWLGQSPDYTNVADSLPKPLLTNG